jgi:hypothetical protein
MRNWTGAAGIAVLALTIEIVYGRGYVGYDAMYSLVWGNDLLHGRSPDFEAPLAPTPHPLAIAAGAVVSVFGDAGTSLFEAAIVISLASLGWIAFLLGRELFSAAVGVLFALLLLTRQLLVAETLQASIDIPFLALVLWAALLEARQRRRGAPVLVLLGIAGLLRPEAWLLAAVYLAYMVPAVTSGNRWRLGLLAVSAPVLWAAFDLAVTGDPLFSLHGTQDLAAQLNRPRELGTALETAPSYVKFILFEPVMWIGIAGAFLSLYALYERSLLPAAVAALGLVAFICLGPFGLPLLVRYLLVPAAMLALFCAVAVLGWLSIPERGRVRYAWGALGVVFAIVLTTSIPDDSRRIRSVERWSDLRRGVQADLHDLVTSSSVEAWYRRCEHPTYVPNHRVVPLLAYSLDREPTAFSLGPIVDRGLVLTPRNETVAASLTLGSREPRPSTEPPRGFRVFQANDSWLLSERC